MNLCHLSHSCTVVLLIYRKTTYDNLMSAGSFLGNRSNGVGNSVVGCPSASHTFITHVQLKRSLWSFFTAVSPNQSAACSVTFYYLLSGSQHATERYLWDIAVWIKLVDQSCSLQSKQNRNGLLTFPNCILLSHGKTMALTSTFR